MGDYFYFKTMVSTSLIQFTYALGALVLTLLSLALIAGTWNNPVAGIALLIFGNLFWRMMCEGMILAFRIHDALVSIDRRLSIGLEADMAAAQGAR